MKRILLLAMLSIFLSATAQAGGYNRGYYNNPWVYGGAFLGGAIVGGMLARPYYSPPAYYAPPPVYYAPPPVYYTAPPVVVDPGTPTEAPPGYRWKNIWDSICQCNRAVLIPQ